VEAGFDQDGDPDVLRALYRLGVRVVQFSTPTCFNGFADSEFGRPTWHGINNHGRRLVALMNELGILIDIAHATPQAQAQLIAESQAPVVASHAALEAVVGNSPNASGLVTDALLADLANKGGLVGIIGTASTISRRYRDWMNAHPEQASRLAAPLMEMSQFASSMTRGSLDHGEFGAWLDDVMRIRHKAAFASPAPDDPGTGALAPTADEWAAHAAHVIRTVGPDHAGIGLDMGGTRSCVPPNASGYPDLIAALRRVTTEENTVKIAGTNWLSVLQRALGA
jgi:membrane dipeptidase